MKSRAKLILVHDEPDSVRAMPQAAPATRASHRAELHRLDHSAGIRIAGPSKNFISLTRNPDLKPPEKFLATVKKPGDIVL